MNLKIRKLTNEDKELIKNWRYSQEYSEFNYALKTNGWIDSYCCGVDTLCFSCKEGENIIGYFIFIERNENEFRILINPDYLGKGFGKKIVKKALEMGFEELEFESITLIVRKYHEVAIKLYKTYGFEIVGEKTEIIENQSIDFYKMVKIKDKK